MADVVEILLQLRNVRQFVSGADKASGAVEGIGKSAESSGKKAKKGWSGLKQWGGGAAVVGAATVYMKGAVGAAVDLNEEINKSSVVFGKSAPALTNWTKSASAKLGMTQQQALAAAGSFGNMLTPMGIAQGKAADMSKNMVQLGADMASFNNASPEETLQAIQSGLAGEAEPLRRFGVFLSEGRLAAQAMSMGLVKASKDTNKIKAAQITAEVAQRKYNAAVKEHGKNSIAAKTALAAQTRAEGALDKAVAGKVPKLNEVQKAQATYGLVLKDTKQQQGDVARTSDSLANRQRQLKAQWTDTSAKLGTALLPMLEKFAGLLATLMSNSTLFYTVLGSLVGLFVIYQGAVMVSTLLTLGFNAALLLIPLAVVAIVAGIVILYKKWGWFHDAVNNTFAWIKKNWPLLLAILLGPIGIAITLIVKNFDKIKSAAKSVYTAVKSIFGSIAGVVKRAFTDPAGFVSGIGRGIADWINAHTPFGDEIKAGPIKFHLPALAAGGTIRAGGAALVGERGPELVTLPTGATVYPTPVVEAAAAAGGGSQTIVTQVFLDRRQIAEAVGSYVADRKARR